MIQALFYSLVPSALGTLGLVWREGREGPRIQRVWLPRADAPVESRIPALYAGIQLRSCPAIAELSERMQRFLAGEAIAFALDRVALEDCSAFQQRVLLAEHQIPRGWVSTYARIAQHLGQPGAARAVGGALANNPFPILIPCHRAIQASGGLGGFQGGPAMKRALLEMEGAHFSAAGRLLAPRLYY